MYKINKQAFTFVELIVVITILAILATIWFWTYQSYLAGGRDTNRLVQLWDIHDGLERYSINSRLPFPEDMIEIQANGNTFAYQGYAWEGVVKAIGYDGGWKDIEYGTYLTYMLWNNQRDFQIMTYIDDNQLLSDTIISSSYANQNYTAKYPKVLGAPLWVLVEDLTNAPLQEIDAVSTAWLFDVVTGSGEIISYFTDTNKIVTRQGGDISMIIPDKSCKRIQELWKWKWSGEYTINPAGGAKQRVYCDMETDGWWWTFAGYLDDSDTADSISFNNALWTYSKDLSSNQGSYSLKMDDLLHSEMMITITNKNPIFANEQWKLIMYKYQTWMPWFYTGPIWCTGFLDEADWFFYKMFLQDEYKWTPAGACTATDWSTRPDPINYPTTPDSWNKYNFSFTNSVDWWGWWKAARWWSSSWGLSEGTSWNQNVWIFVR